MKKVLLMVAVLALVAAACGGDDDAVSAASCEAGQVDGNLNFYNWSEYIDPELIEAFEAEYGVDVIESFYESNEAMLAQLQSGVSYDLIVPSDYMVAIMIQEGLLVELNKDAIPNFANMAERFTTQPYDNGAKYSAAYQYGTTGLGVNVSLVGEDFPRSWALLFDPALTANFPGGVSVLNDPRETMGAALEYLGYSINDTDIDHLNEAVAVIQAAKANIATFDSDQYDEALVTGQVAVSHGYSGNMILAIGDADNPDDFVYILPEEGATLWVDNMAIPTNSAAVCTAHAFINFLLDAENGAALTNWNYYASPNAASTPFIDQEVNDFNAEADTAKLEVIVDQGDYEINYTDAFAEAKS
ncbi:MAG: spermidine/putrescine ABC transporter substrate-binding protein [Acidimicrobiia bacterium]|nr:spermidine/putrescine ABC transporter substrate-binding protein [Acidimicrobiia bacterium]